VYRDLRWHSVPSEVTLKGDEVHVWRVWMRQFHPRVGELLRLLTLDEMARADRFHFMEDRQRFVIARGMLRVILSRYVKVRPAELRLVYSAFGKPSLNDDECSSGLQFNLAHSHEVVLYAVTSGRRVGIDVEHIRADMAVSEIAERFFSGPEVDAFNALPTESRVEGFFNCWTRKEAYIKARGEGLSFPLDGFAVSLNPGEPAALLSVINQPQERARWSLQDLPVGSGYAAALAVEGDGWALNCWSEQG
jgi:4'-phosphopantetheinyl transferase